MGRRKKDAPKNGLDLRAESVVTLLENNPQLTLEDASREVGFSFKELSKGTREEILDNLKKHISKWFLTPEARKELVKSIENAGAITALAAGNLSGALDYTDRISQDPEVNLRQKQAPVTVLTIEGLEKVIEAAAAADTPVIDITAEKKEEKSE